jgi:hypothetical protein
MRKQAVAGSFYEASFEALDKQIRQCFLSKLGPGELPVTKRKGKIIGAICPHAGYAFSGPCAAWAYKEIAEATFPDLFIIIGPNHYGGEGSCTTLEDFETSLGTVAVDKSFARRLIDYNLVVDQESHAAEHSIEVQLPFLQFANKDYLNSIRFFPILVSSNANYKKLGLAIKEAVIDSNKNVCIIASSDFTHYGHNYGYVPFSTDVKKRMYELDAGAINFIKNLDAEGFLNYCYETGATICGQLAIATLLKSVKAKSVRLLHYYTSGDVLGDYRNAVGYASLVLD